jgi:caffeoyl-CoA O-methyltransferase
MQPILNSKIEAYLHSILDDRHDHVLREMEEFGKKTNFPIVGPLVGRLIFVVAKSLGAKIVFEMGSGFGYSAYWFAHAVGPEGRVICTEASQENVARGKNYMHRAGLEHRLEWHHGNALEIIQRFDGPFDIVFNDVNKHQYPDAFAAAYPKIRRGGLFMSDNMLWFGRVVEPNPDENTRGIMELTQILYAHRDLTTTIVPLRDGVSISWKK